ncbi:MAG: AraC family transcriptional regulator [Alistipes sp.]|nr:AraC family transcriptional regulator [Alistipes sp.]
MSPAEKKKKAARQSIKRSSRKREQQERQATGRGRMAQPVAVRSTETSASGIRTFSVSRYVLGYVVSGTKYIWSGDMRYEVCAGDVFFLSKGVHYVEDAPDSRKPFEQVMFFYSSEQIGRIVAQLNVEYGIDIVVCHSCEECLARDYVIAPGWSTVKHFFASVRQQLKEGYFEDNAAAGMLSLTLLVYYIVACPEGCLRTRVLGSSDPEKELIERLLQNYIFSKTTLSELALVNNRSLSSFKKKFKDYFHQSPHKWVVGQRLMHARLLVISTKKSTAQIGTECAMPNTSHFIRQFKSMYGTTPMEYRRAYKVEEAARVETDEFSYDDDPIVE